jgi:hypothetical protein
MLSFAENISGAKKRLKKGAKQVNYTRLGHFCENAEVAAKMAGI